MDILLDSNGDLAFKGTDIVLANSVRQKIKIRLKWFFQEWRWDDEAGVPYFEYLFVKNPDIDQIKELIEEQIFNVDEITEVNDVSIEIDSLKRSAGSPSISSYLVAATVSILPKVSRCCGPTLVISPTVGCTSSTSSLMSPLWRAPISAINT